MSRRTLHLRGSSVALATAAALLLTGTHSAGAAETQLPVGQAEGVRVVQNGGGLTVVFSKRAERLYRRIAGKRVTIVCSTTSRGDGFITPSNGTSVNVRAPKLRRPLRTGLVSRRDDYCRLWIAKRVVRTRSGTSTSGPKLVVAIPLTQRGAVHLDEERNAITLFSILIHSGVAADNRDWAGTFLPTDALVRLLRGRGADKPPLDVTALATPADTPPRGSVGYYSDGREHAAAVTVSAAGRRLFFELLPDDELRTNVLGYIDGLDDEMR